MIIDFKADVSSVLEAPPKDGQISVKLPKDDEIRFKMLNLKHGRQLSKFMREFALKLMDAVESQSKSAS